MRGIRQKYSDLIPKLLQKKEINDFRIYNLQ